MGVGFAVLLEVGWTSCSLPPPASQASSGTKASALQQARSQLTKRG